MVVTCSQCGYENDPRHQFCGMCGEPLRAPYVAPTAPNRPLPGISGHAPVAERTVPEISGPSILGLGGDEGSSRSADYLLDEQDEPRSGHGLVYVVLLLLVAGAAVGAWRWREGGYPWEARAPKPPAASSVAPSAVTPPADTNTANSTTPAPDANASTATPAATTPAASNPVNPAPDATNPPAGTGDAQPASKPPAGDSATPNSEPAPESKPAEPKAAAPVAESKPQPAKPVVAHKAAPKRAPAADDSSDDADADTQTADAPPPRKAAPSRREVALATPADPTDAWVSDGQKYLYGNGVPQNCARAKAQMLAAAARSNAEAQSTLGTMYATGHCVDRNVISAYRWFAQALHNDRSNTRIEQDLRVLWSQMTPQEQQAAIAGHQ